MILRVERAAVVYAEGNRLGMNWASSVFKTSFHSWSSLTFYSLSSHSVRSKVRFTQPIGPVHHLWELTGSLLWGLSCDGTARWCPYATAAIQGLALIRLKGNKKFQNWLKAGLNGSSLLFRSTSRYHRVSIILIKFIFADNNNDNNNCKYNLTNYLTHNILYM